MPPEVSVIIPSYNHALYLRECIESVIWQSYQDWELIIVDDWSGDESLEIAGRFSDPRIQAFKNKANLGTYETQNVGIDRARGKYIAILNSDDVWLPRKLQAQVEQLAKHRDCFFCYTGSQLVDEEGNKLAGDIKFHGDYPRSEKQDLLPYLLFENRVLASSLLFKKGAVRFNKALRYTGDWIALLGLASRGPAAYVDEPLTVWRQHPENSYTRLQRVLPEEIALREAILGRERYWREASMGLAEVNKRLSLSALALAALYIRTGKNVLAREKAQLARKLDPENRRAQRLHYLSLLPGSLARRRLWQEREVLELGTLDLRPEEIFWGGES